jgi:hypothetical protein
MSFWNIFKNTTYVRASWAIQDKIIDTVNDIQEAAAEQERIDSMIENSSEIIDAVHNNPFTKERNKSK